MQKKRFISNVIIISLSSLFLRMGAMAVNIFIASRLGASSMGVYHLIFSLFAFGMTLSSSGTGFAATRLVSEKNSDERLVIKKCLCVSLFMSLLGFLIFFLGASFIEESFIRHKGSASAVRLLAFCLPCMSTSSVLRGYFIAKRKAGVMTISSVTEEIISILVTFSLLNIFKNSPDSYMCLIYGCLVSNLSALVIDFAFYKSSSAKEVVCAKKPRFKDILSICVPIALGSYIKSALVATENLMIPLQFEKFGVQSPLSEYGIIKAMAMSVIMFPTSFVYAFSSMLVPEMSEMNSLGRKNGIKYVTGLATENIMMFSFFISLMLFCHHGIISRTFFKEPAVSGYIFMLSLLAVPLYLDNVADNILKGLGLQNSCLLYNIIDSALRIVFIIIFMPRFGPLAYIAMLYLSEIFNLSLSLKKASKATGFKINWFSSFILPFICFVSAVLIKNPVFQTAVYFGLYCLLSKKISAKKLLGGR